MTGLPSNVLVEVEFTAGTWTDVTRYVDANQHVTGRVGRQTEFGDVGPSTCQLVLRNDDGRFTPDSAGSPYYPDVIEGKRLRVTVYRTPTAGSTAGFTGIPSVAAAEAGTLWPGLPTTPAEDGAYPLFTGEILSWEPSFASRSMTTGTVTVQATDALATLARHTFDDKWTEQARYLARTASTWADVFVLKGDASTRAYSNVGEADGGTLGAGTLVVPTAGTGEVSYGAPDTITLSSAATFKPVNASGRVLQVVPQAAPSLVAFWLRVDKDSTVPSTSRVALSLRTSGDAAVGSLRLFDSAGATALGVYNAAGTVLSTLTDPVADSTWRLVTLTASSGSTVVAVTDGTTTTTYTAAFDLTTAGKVNLGGDLTGTSASRCADMTAAGLIVAGDATVAPATTIAQAGQTYVHTDLFTALQAYVPEFTSWAATGGESRTVGEPTWAGQTALDVLQVLARTINGVAYATGSGVVTLAAADVVRPTVSAASIDIEEDLDAESALPTLRRAADSRPTRVTIDYAGGSTTLIDTAAEANGQPRREQKLTTCATDTTGAEFAGSYLLQAANGLRITQVAVDLTTSMQDLWATLLGLYPTQRLTASGFDATILGTTTHEFYAQGWQWSLGPDSVVFTLDCSPAAQFVGASWDGGDEYGRFAVDDGVWTGTGGTAMGITGTGTLIITSSDPAAVLSTTSSDYPMLLSWDGEAVQVTSAPVSAVSPQTVTITARAQENTAAQIHLIGEAVAPFHQAVWSF